MVRPVFSLAVGLVVGACGGAPAPAPVTESLGAAHRLTPAEVDNSLADILGAPTRRAEAAGLPADLGEFSVLSERQVDGPLVVEALLDATQRSVDDALAPRPTQFKTQPVDLGFADGQPLQDPLGGDPAWVVHRTSSRDVALEIPWSGSFTATYRVAAFGVALFIDDRDEPSPPVARITDIRSGQSASVAIPLDGDLTWYDLTVTTTGGPGPWPLRLEVETDGWFGVAIQGVYLDGVPDDPAVLTAPALRWLACDDADCLRAGLAGAGRLAWRRGLTEAELDELVAWATSVAEDSPASRLGWGLKGLFASPYFLFRAEDAAEPGATHRPLTPTELAGRLALFLWSSAPDDALMDCAATSLAVDDAGPCGLAAQVDRMLADPRAEALLAGFGEQWLRIDGLEHLPRDPVLYPTWSPRLAASMRAETRSLLGRSLFDDLPIRDLLTHPTTQLDDALAALYGVDDGASGTRSWTWPEGAAAGLLRQASVLTITSQPQRTSIVGRGVYVLDRLLCDPPGAPPAVVPPLAGDDEAALDAHVAPACASCHAEIDPLGVPLEGFDAIGAARLADGAPPATQSTLVDGTAVDGPAALSRWIADHRSLPTCVGSKLLTWALARELRAADQAEVVALDQALGADASLADWARAIALSPAFRTWTSAP